MSSFDGEDIFGSGPHRFAPGARGSEVRRVAEVSGDPSQPGLQTTGPLDAEVIVRGRLVAANDAALEAVWAGVREKTEDPPLVGDLVDHAGNTYGGFALVSVTPADRVDRGAMVSVGYTARFMKFGGW